MQRKRIEIIIISDLKEKFVTPQNLRIYKKDYSNSLFEITNELKQKRNHYEKVQIELQNLLNFIKAGNFSKRVSEAIIEAENRSEKLKKEMQSLKLQQKNAFYVAHTNIQILALLDDEFRDSSSDRAF